MGTAAEILGLPTRKREKVFISEWDREVVVLELSSEARLVFTDAITVDPATQTGKVNMSCLIPYVTELIVDADTGDQMFDLAAHDTLVRDHPGAVGKVLNKAFTLSEIGAEAESRAEGNSEATAT